MLRTTRLALTSIESVSAGVDSRKNRTVDLFYRNAALADSTTLRGGNGYVAMRLRLRCGCRFSHSTRAWGVTTRVFDHSAGGYRFAFSQFAGGLSARFVHFAGGIRDLTIARGVITDSTNSRGVIALHMNANTTELRRFDQPPGGWKTFPTIPRGDKLRTTCDRSSPGSKCHDPLEPFANPSRFR